MSHDIEEWCNIWRKTDLLLQKWPEFGEFWPEHSKASKICTVIGSFCAKGITFDLKKTHLWFEKWHDEFCQFSPEHLKVSKLGLWWDPFVQSRKCMSWKFTEELSVMTLKNYEKCLKKLTCCFKIVTNFDKSTGKSQNFHFNGLLLTKVYIVLTKKVQRSYLSWHWRVMQNSKKYWLVVWKMTGRIQQIFTRALENLKIGTLMGSFYSK